MLKKISVTAALLGLLVSVQPVARASVLERAAGTWMTNGTVWAILRVDDVIYIGGEFTEILDNQGHRARRNHVAAFDAVTGRPRRWNPSANGTVYAIAAGRTRVFIGGTFTSVRGISHPRLAATDPYTGALLRNWRGIASSSVRDLLVTGKTLYAGGTFRSLNRQPRGRVGALATRDGHLLSFRANTNGGVRTLALSLDNKALYVGGYFTTIGGRREPKIAAVEIASGRVRPWADTPPSDIVSIAATSQGIYAAFSGYKRTPNEFARYTSAGQTVWRRHLTGAVQSLAYQDGEIYVGGHFDKVGTNVSGIPRHRVASFLPNGSLTRWNPDVNYGSRPGGAALGPRVVVPCRAGICIGGDFTRVNGNVRLHFALFRG